ncbi:MAG: hypothetical protein ACO1NM_10660 [Sphingobium phenoxybenzoativorans]|nr:hypothetical protein [Sphingobium phenoxybenzoativorans]
MESARYVAVQPPMAHEGVGRALRAAYIAKGDDLPNEMARLLQRLDKL